MTPISKENSEPFHLESYEKHTDWYTNLYPEDEDKRLLLRKIRPNNTISDWLQSVFFSCIDPLLLNSSNSWLTVGDAYGLDASYILSKGVKDITASDLSTHFLKIANEEGLIGKFAAENAERLSGGDSSIDYVLCKEAYHHFPRPYAALYEMIRVAKKAIVIIEPQDPISKMPLLLWLTNVLGAINPAYISKVWKNQFSYEPVGNFVYKVSEREFEKFAAGLGFPLVAFKKINPNFWYEGLEQYQAVPQEKRFKKVLFKKRVFDLLVRVGLVSSHVLGTVVFKEMPDQETISRMKQAGYRFVEIPKNPYL